jgi:crossover junction endodeoxyribonuclease RuvC
VDSFRAIGVDPGLAKTGYAVVEVTGRKAIAREWDCISTDAKTPTPNRLQIIFTNFEAIVRKWEARFLIVEDVYVLPRYPKAALLLGAVRGVLTLSAAIANMEIMELKPTEVKMALTGNGRANKEQVEKAVRRMLTVPERITPEHASDALALAVVGLSRFGAMQW